MSFIYGCVVAPRPDRDRDPVHPPVQPSDGVAGFRLWIFVTLFLLFICFALNMMVDLPCQGRWRDLCSAEKVYIWLEHHHQDGAHWQVYSGALAGS